MQLGGPKVNANPVILKIPSKGAGLLWGFFFTSHGEAEFHILVTKRSHPVVVELLSLEGFSGCVIF